MQAMSSLYQANLAAAASALERAAALEPCIEAAADVIAECYRAGGKLLVCGNGGSAAEAGHLATEFVVRFLADRRALPAINLTASGADLTAVGNDYRFEEIFSRQVEAYGQPSDVLVSFSASGNSENVRLALVAAGERGMKAVSLLGRDGGACAGLGTVDILVAEQVTARIQEVHLLILHTLCGLVEQRLFAS